MPRTAHAARSSARFAVAGVVAVAVFAGVALVTVAGSPGRNQGPVVVLLCGNCWGGK